MPPFKMILKGFANDRGELNWQGFGKMAKTMAPLMMKMMKSKDGGEKKATAMEEMMKKMAEKKIPSDWQARIGDDPIKDAFEVKRAAHVTAGVDMMMPPPFVPDAAPYLTKIPRKGRTACYINVPFCQTRCDFCMFYIGPYKKEESARYADALLKEIDLWADSPAVGSAPIHAVYMGGGTPTALESEDLYRIIKACHDRLPLANDVEFTVEGRLSYFDDQKIEACLKAGANRFSLGVQTFDTEIRRSVGRLSSREELISGLEKLCSYDEAAVIIDLIFGLPGQTEETWQNDLETAASLPIHGVDLYQLILLEGSPLDKLIKAGRHKPAPDNRMRADMYRQGCAFMEKVRWRQLSVSHFARSTRERNLYNVLAKSDADTLAFGPGAGGKVNGVQFMNTRKYEDYMAKIGEGKIAAGMIFIPDDKWRIYKDLGEQLELGALDFKALKERHGTDVREMASGVFAQWQEAGLLNLDERFAVLTLAGRYWAVTMTQHLCEYLEAKLKEKK